MLASCRLLCIVAIAALATGCSDDNELSGSISESHSLAFDRVTVRLQDTWLILAYLRDRPSGTEKVCKLVIDTDGLPDGATTIAGDEFFERVNLQRSTFADDAFPPIESGEIVFDELDLQPSGDVSGEFIIQFDTGHTLIGIFGGKTELLHAEDDTSPL